VKLLAATLILPTTVVLAIAILETRVLYPPPENAPTRGLVWAGQTFVARADFARWLRSRGLTYRAWVRRHPAPASVVRSPWGRRPVQRAAELGRSHRRYSWALAGLGGIALVATLSLLLGFARRGRLRGSGGWRRRTLQLPAPQLVRAAKGGARLILRWGKATTLLASSLARKIPAKTIRLRGAEFARSAARRTAPVAKAGARLMMRWATATALLSLSLAASSANTVRRRRSELAWYSAAALFAAGVGVVATVWLNRV
jgi:hypothetical protein